MTTEGISSDLHSVNEIDDIDKEFMWLIIEGHKSAYAIWSAYKKNLEGGANRVMAYKNVNQRITRLSRIKIIEEVKPDAYTVNLHGRKDYKITMEGMKQLVPYVMHRHNISDKIIEYIDRAGLKREVLQPILENEFKMTQDRVDNMIGMASAINLDESVRDFISWIANISEMHIEMKKSYLEDLKLDMRASYLETAKKAAAAGKRLETETRRKIKSANKQQRKSK